MYLRKIEITITLIPKNIRMVSVNPITRDCADMEYHRVINRGLKAASCLVLKDNHV